MSTKELHLLRHAKSDWDDPTLADHERPLAPQGRKAAPLIGHYMVEAKLSVDLVLCSTARRAQQTLSLVLPALEGIPVVYERSVYTFDASSLVNRLRLVDDAVASMLVIGHNTALEDMILTLCSPDARRAEASVSPLGPVPTKLPTAALASLEFDGPWSSLAYPLHETVRLTRFIRPKDLRQNILPHPRTPDAL